MRPRSYAANDVVVAVVDVDAVNACCDDDEDDDDGGC